MPRKTTGSTGKTTGSSGTGTDANIASGNASGPSQSQARSPQAAFDCGAAISTDTMERFVDSFGKSTRRWEVVVYPALFAFIVLAAYGFFLIFSLTKDLDQIATGVDRMNDHIATMNNTVATMSGKLDTLGPMLTRLERMDESMASITDSVGSLNNTIRVMDQSVRTMAHSGDQMRHQMGVLTHNIARPMSIMNSFMP